MEVEDIAEIEEEDDERNEYLVESLNGEHNSSQEDQYVIQPQHSKTNEYEIRRKEGSEKDFEILPFETNDTSCSFKGESDPKVDIIGNSILNSNERFLLSCAPALQRLTARQNAFVRLSIQQLLFDVEFGNEEPPLKKHKL